MTVRLHQKQKYTTLFLVLFVFVVLNLCFKKTILILFLRGLADGLTILREIVAINSAKRTTEAKHENRSPSAVVNEQNRRRDSLCALAANCFAVQTNRSNVISYLTTGANCTSDAFFALLTTGSTV